MFSKKHVILSGKRMLICLLLCLMMLPAAGAETVAAQQVAAPVDPIQEEGAQIHTGPVLMVKDYSIVEGEKVPGSSFVMEMNIVNLSETASAHNLLVTLNIENVSVALQEGATNQAYFHELQPGQTVSVRFPMEVYSYCADENMILSLTMSCCDEYAVRYDFQTMMTPEVDVVRTLYVSSLAVPQFVHRNSSMIISASLVNTEPVTLDNIRMHVVTQYGEQVTEVGRLISEESKTVDCIYRFPEQQTENVQVYFTYESLSGRRYTTESRAFEVVVYDPAEQGDFAASDGMSISEILDRLTQSTVIPGVDEPIPVPVVTWILLGCIGYIAVLIRVLRRKEGE